MNKNRAKYDRGPYDLSALPETHIDRLTLERIGKHHRVLELGCATGYMTEYMNKTLGCSVVAVDYDSSSVKIAKDTGLDVIQGDLNTEKTWNLIAKNGLFDTVLAANIIEHLVDTDFQLSHIHNSLESSGRLVIVVPNICWWRSRLSLLRGVWQYQPYGLFDETHLKFFSLPSLRNTLQKNGFMVLDEAYDPAGGAKWLTPLLQKFPNAYAYQVVMVAEKINR